MLELNGNSSYCKILRYSNWTSDGALDNNNCNYYNNNHSTPRLEVRPVPEEGCHDVPAAVPDPAQGDKQDRAELQAEEPTGSTRTSPPSEGGRAPPPPAMTPPPPPWAQPRQCGSLPCDFWLVNQCTAVVTSRLCSTTIPPTIPRCTELGTSGLHYFGTIFSDQYKWKYTCHSSLSFSRLDLTFWRNSPMFAFAVSISGGTDWTGCGSECR